jgi:archaellum component FlaF (FlaF/FlaG flagellin family)
VQVTISTAILLITTIIMASIFTGAALSQLYSFQNSFKEVSSRNQEIFASSISIIGETKSSSPNRIIIWVKNIGQTSFPLTGSTTNATYWDLFITFPNGTYERFTYDPTAQSNCWDVQILNDKGAVGVWEDGETIQLTIYTYTIPSGAYEIRLTLSNGVSNQDKFSLS